MPIHAAVVSFACLLAADTENPVVIEPDPFVVASHVDTATLTLTNTGDAPVRVMDARPKCCSVDIQLIRGTTIEPGESLECIATFRTAHRLPAGTSNVTFMFEDVGPIEVPVYASHVVASRAWFSDTNNADGAFTLRSIDGEDFRILGADPPAIQAVDVARHEHELSLDWDVMFASGDHRLVIETDHAEAPRVTIWLSGAHVEPSPVEAGGVVVEPRFLARRGGYVDDDSIRTLELTNTGDTPRMLMDFTKSRGFCKAVAIDYPKGKVLQPGETLEVAINLRSGQRDRIGPGHLVFVIEDQAPIIVPVEGEPRPAVEMSPARLDPAVHADGAFQLASIDGVPFRITSMHPPVIVDFPEVPAIKHELYFDWGRWVELGSRRKLLFYIDHPESVRLYADVNVQLKAVQPISGGSISIEPARLDFGHAYGDQSRTGYVTLTNTSRTVKRLLRAKVTCDCAQVCCPEDVELRPGESIDATVTLRGSAMKRAVQTRIAFEIEGQEPVELPVWMDVTTAVVASQRRVMRNSHDPIVLEADDGAAFRVIGVYPEGVVSFSDDPRTTHELVVDWERWDAVARGRRMIVYVNHPMCDRAYVEVVGR